MRFLPQVSVIQGHVSASWLMDNKWGLNIYIYRVKDEYILVL